MMVTLAALDQGVARFLGVADGDGQMKLSDVRTRATGELSRYGDDLLNVLASHGLSVPPAIHLASTQEGGVAVLNDHPEKTRIEAVINADTRLLKWYKEVEVLFDIVRRAELRGSGQTLADQHFNLGLTSAGPIGFFAAG
ncbi:hypothetical protein ACTSKR_11775 [Chitinibacteraceae bacterium HSL-7]